MRFPDPGANPYLAYAAMLMAGIDGIENKIHPGEPMDKDLYALPPEELKDIPQVCGSLREALSHLDTNRAFLKKGGVFTDDFIDSYLELKMGEVYAFEHTPHPVEFKMYYSVQRHRILENQKGAVQAAPFFVLHSPPLAGAAIGYSISKSLLVIPGAVTQFASRREGRGR